jgi:cytochrome c556
MKRWALGAGILALATVALAGGRDDQQPTIKEIMEKAHKGTKQSQALLTQVRNELKKDDPNWEKVQKQAKELVSLGTSLGKNEPPRGDKESWEKLTAAYVANAKKLEAGAEEKDQAAARAAVAKLGGSCRSCHMAHKGS